MPLIKYENKKFPSWKIEIIQQTAAIIKEYQDRGYDLTLRQVFYQFVARDLLPQRWADPKTGSTNNQKSYKNLGNLIADARMAGILDWTSLVDRTREMGGNSHWNDPQAIVSACAHQFRLDKWADQPYRPEVWVEKDALEGVVAQTAKRMDVPYFSCRGYTSLTSIWENAQRLKTIAMKGSTPIILHLGDHDPSGIDMSRDIEERVRLFMGEFGDSLQFNRLALNMDQIEQYHPPENPVKITDTRSNKYQDQFGDHCWELDALDPAVIDNLIETNVLKVRTEKLFRAKEKEEQHHRDMLDWASKNWSKIETLARRNGAK